MTNDKNKLLILSNFTQFLSEFSPRLSEEFAVERANSETMLLFLCNEWEPKLILVDGDSSFVNAINLLRDRIQSNSLGLICFAKEISPPKEEKLLRGGADLVTHLPVNYSGLQAKVQCVLRRLSHEAQVKAPLAKPPNDNISFQQITLYSQSGLVKRGEQILTASPLQFKILQIFLRNREQLLSRQHIREQVWQNAPISPRSIDAHISKLKRLIPELEDHLINIYGKGYLFTDSRRLAA